MRSASIPIRLDPLDIAACGSHLTGFAAYFGDDDHEIAALGSAWRTDAPYGEERFAQLSEAVSGIPIPDDVPVLVGFAFDESGAVRPEWDGFNASSAVVPMIAVRRTGTQTRLFVTLAPGAANFEALALLRQLPAERQDRRPRAADHTIESSPSPGTWEASVADAVEAIKVGAFHKVVLARSLRVTADVPVRPFDLVRRLRTDYASCFVYGWQQGAATFVGASPELLMAKQGDRLRSHPLAGSAPRGVGEDADQAIGEALMASSKDREEHRAVVDDIVARLEPIVAELSVDRVPSLRKLTNVQHLSTEIAGRIGGQQTVLDLAGVIHPTPAVGGTPHGDALAFIRKSEGFDRGWYAGGVGWASTGGDGVIALALRCALLRGDRAWLYAGAGIVADSEPSAELDETRLKFRPMLELLTES